MPMMLPYLTYENAQQYITSLSNTSNPTLIEKIEQSTQLHFLEQSHMLLGRSGGNLLALLVHLLQPQKIVELGTFTGYSTSFLADYLPIGAKLYTVDVNPDYLDVARHNLSSHPHSDQIELVEKDATAFLKSFDGTIDLAFVDANKQVYQTHYTLLKERLHPRGLIVVDNAFFHGEVFLSEKGKIATSIHLFNQYIAQDLDVLATLLPIRDGIWIITPKMKK